MLQSLYSWTPGAFPHTRHGAVKSVTEKRRYKNGQHWGWRHLYRYRSFARQSYVKDSIRASKSARNFTVSHSIPPSSQLATIHAAAMPTA